MKKLAKKASTPSKNVRLKHGSYYYVSRPVGSKHQKWKKLCSEKDGEIAALIAVKEYQKVDLGWATTLSELLDDYLVNYFLLEKQSGSKETNDAALKNLSSHIKKIKAEIGSNAVSTIETKDLNEWLTLAYMPSLVRNLTSSERMAAKEHDKPNSFNKYRTTLINVFNYALRESLIPSKINPAVAIKKKKEESSARSVTDSEIRRIKQGLLRGEDGNRTRVGVMMCLVIDFALLTAQRAKDVRLLQWSDIKQEGILFKPTKTAAKTGERILIEWTPKLRAVIDRVLSMKTRHIKYVFTNSSAKPLSATAMTQAWSAAMERCTSRGTLPLENRPQFRYLRRAAITAVVEAAGRGWVDGQAMGAHASVQQTVDYVSSEKLFVTKQTKASR